MPAGTIKKLVYDKGFGFIAGSDGSDVFFHHSVVADRASTTWRKANRSITQSTLREDRAPKVRER